MNNDWPIHPYLFQLLIINALWYIMKAVCVPKTELDDWRDMINRGAKERYGKEIIE